MVRVMVRTRAWLVAWRCWRRRGLARASKRLERGRGLGEGGLKGIKEGAAGGFGPGGAEETGADVVLIGNPGAVAGQMARDGEVQQGLEEGIGERGGVQRQGHNNKKRQP